MSDDDRFLEEDVSVHEDVQSGKKVGLLPAMLIKILKWSAMGVAAVIFIVTVVVITVNILNNGNQTSVYAQISPEYQGKPPVYEWYTNINEIRGRTSDETPHTVLVRPSIGYDPSNKAVQTELIQRTPQLRDLIRGYFSAKTSTELQPANEIQVKLELKELINRVMTQGKIKEVIFLDFNVFEL